VCLVLLLQIPVTFLLSPASIFGLRVDLSCLCPRQLVFPPSPFFLLDFSFPSLVSAFCLDRSLSPLSFCCELDLDFDFEFSVPATDSRTGDRALVRVFCRGSARAQVSAPAGNRFSHSRLLSSRNAERARRGQELAICRSPREQSRAGSRRIWVLVVLFCPIFGGKSRSLISCSRALHRLHWRFPHGLVSIVTVAQVPITITPPWEDTLTPLIIPTPPPPAEHLTSQ
jgi:hypothetical protein